MCNLNLLGAAATSTRKARVASATISANSTSRAPIRRLVPPAGGIDFSPLILLVLLQILGHALI